MNSHFELEGENLIPRNDTQGSIGLWELDEEGNLMPKEEPREYDTYFENNDKYEAIQPRDIVISLLEGDIQDVGTLEHFVFRQTIDLFEGTIQDTGILEHFPAGLTEFVGDIQDTGELIHYEIPLTEFIGDITDEGELEVIEIPVTEFVVDVSDEGALEVVEIPVVEFVADISDIAELEVYGVPITNFIGTITDEGALEVVIFKPIVEDGKRKKYEIKIDKSPRRRWYGRN